MRKKQRIGEIKKEKRNKKYKKQKKNTSCSGYQTSLYAVLSLIYKKGIVEQKLLMLFVKIWTIENVSKNHQYKVHEGQVFNTS